MSVEVAAGVLGLIIFGTVVYVMNFKRTEGRWPKVRSPFY